MLLFPCLFSIPWYLAFLAADWSGLSVPLCSNCFVAALWACGLNPTPQTIHVLYGRCDYFGSTLSFSLLSSLPWELVCFDSSGLSLVLVVLLSLSFLGFALFSPCLVRVLLGSLSLSPSLSALSLFASPSGVVPGLSGRRLVRISSATLTSPFLPPALSLPCFDYLL